MVLRGLMMLHGTAKRDYMREYMRKRRAGEPTRKPKPEWEPTQRMVDEVEHWFYLKLHRRRDLRGIGRAVVAGLDPHNEDGTANEASWTEALQRYRKLRAEQRAGRRVRRKREEAERNAPPPPKRCSFCNEPASAKSTLVGPSDYSFPLICETCTKEAPGSALMITDLKDLQRGRRFRREGVQHNRAQTIPASRGERISPVAVAVLHGAELHDPRPVRRRSALGSRRERDPQRHVRPRPEARGKLTAAR